MRYCFIADVSLLIYLKFNNFLKYIVLFYRIPVYQKNLQQANADLGNIQQQLDVFNEQLGTVDLQIVERKEAADRIKRSLSSMQDSFQLFKKRIPAKYSGSAKAMDWLRENSGQLRGQCFGPIGAFIKVQYSGN